VSAEPEVNGNGTLAIVAQLIREVIAEDWIWETTIRRETSFADDLLFQSVEVVTLAEKLNERYGDEVDFIGWISEMENDQIMRLEVGQLVDYVDASRA
jgi:acyl carrier protein